jgi:Flp pilus assembly protein TadG
MESVKTNTAGVKDSTGLGLTVGYALSSANSINVNYARNDDSKLNSLGLNGTFGAFGAGYIRDNNETNSTSADTVYAAYSFPLMGLKGATITPAISSSTGTGVQALQAVRVRLNYAF